MVAWPQARYRIGIASPILAIVALTLVPITTGSGYLLMLALPQSPLIQEHFALGETLLPWVIALFVIAFGSWLWYHFWARGMSIRTQKIITILFTIAALIVAVGVIWDIALIGDSGARARWQGQFNPAAP